jgi:hypothetical protein
MKKSHIKWRANVTIGHYPHINKALSLHKIPATTKAGVALRKTSLKAQIQGCEILQILKSEFVWG